MMSLQELYEGFLRVAETGDEAAAEKYVVDHIQEFPQEIRDKLMFAIFERAVHKQAENLEASTALKQAGLDLISQLEAAIRETDNQIRIEELKSDLGITKE